jgi:hypothetical protein
MSASGPYRPRHGSAAAAVSLLSAIAVAMLLAIASPAEAKKKSHITFAGLESATTCIGGPIGGGRTSSYHLSWQPATDRNARARIVYEVYQATAPGAEDFSRPTYTTARGAASFDTPQLASEESFYFVVRARDRAGNEDSNTVEREGQNLCL